MADSCASDEFSLSPLNLIPAPSSLKFSGNRKYAKGQFQCYLSSFLIWHSIWVHLATNHHSYDFMLTQKFTSSVWPSLQVSWTVCMILFCSVSVLVEPFFSCRKTSSYCIRSLTFHSCGFGLFAVFSSIFSFFPPFWGAFSLMSSSFHFPGLKLILLFHLIFCRMEFWWLKKKKT